MSSSIAARILAGLLALGSPGAAQEQVNYSWSFESGNLVSNWSFEEIADETGNNSSVGGVTFAERVSASDAPSGAFVMRVNTATTGIDDEGASQITAILPVKPSTTYRFTIMVKATGNGSNEGWPSFRFYKANKTTHASVGYHPCQEYRHQVSLNGQWQEYACEFTTSSDAFFTDLTYLRHGHGQYSGNVFSFDNLHLREKGKGDQITSSRSYGNAAGMVDQSVVNDGTMDLIAQTYYDQFGRPSRTYLPLKHAGLSRFDYLLVGERASGELLNYDFSNLNDAFAFMKAFVASYPAIQITSPQIIKVVADPNNPVAFAKSPDRSQVIYSWDNQPIPVQLQGILKGSPAYAALSNRGYSPSNRKYTPSQILAMAESQYGMANRPFSEAIYPAPWTNLQMQTAPPGAGFGPVDGHLGQSGWALTNSLDRPANPEVMGSTSSAEQSMVYQWSRDAMGGYQLSWLDGDGNAVKTENTSSDPENWDITENLYDFYGRLTETYTPIGYFKNYDAYDGSGRLLRESETDRGERMYTYDDFGRLKASAQLSLEPYSFMHQVFTDYDPLNRIVATGHQRDQGYIFDELTPASFLEKTGISLATVGLADLKLANTRGKLACDFNKNSPVASYLSGTPESRLVATFYAYDTDGRIAKAIKYIGALKTASDRLQEVEYAYDDLNRLERITVYRRRGTSDITEESNFVYDGLGRVVNVFDQWGRVKVDYRFDDLGRLSSADLYGKIRIDYTQDLQTKLRQLKYSSNSSGQVVYSENLAYENHVHADLPSDHSFVPRWDGKISAAFKNYGLGLAEPAQMLRYQYNLSGQLTQSVREGFPQSSLSPLGEPKFGDLGSTASTSGSNFSYDGNGRILSQVRDGYQYTHNYSGLNTTHQVKSVTGNYPTSTRNMTGPSNFSYDGAGRLIGDISLGKSLNYNHDGQPVRIAVGNRTFVLYYDADGARTAIWETGAAVGKVYVRFSPDQAAKEITQNNSGTVKIRNNVFGANSQVGYEETGLDHLRLLIKDNLGSTVKTILYENPSSADHFTYRFSDYGIKSNLSVPASDEGATGTFTGKEFDDVFKTYDFGARQYDPDLGMWLGPDPAEQYVNPYSYGGGDPINTIDRDGKTSECASGITDLVQNGYTCTESGGTTTTTGTASADESGIVVNKTKAGILQGALIHAVPSQDGVSPEAAQAAVLRWSTPSQLDNALHMNLSSSQAGNTPDGNAYQNTVNNIRSTSFQTMSDNGGSYNIATGDFTAFQGDAHQWAVGFGMNTLANMAPATWTEAAFMVATLALPVGMAAKEAYVLGNMEKAMATSVYAGAAKHVNPLGGTINCVNCALAMDQTLAGYPASALLTTKDQPLVALGKNWTSVTGKTQIENTLLKAGLGSRGIVFGTNPGAPYGHVWNAVNQKGAVNFIDAQSGGAGAHNFNNFLSFQFLRTY